MNKVEKLKELGEAIHDKGNTHNPEYWETGDKITYAADHIKDSENWGVVDQVKSSLDKAMNTEDTRVTKPANETIIAVLTGNADGNKCNGCGEMKQMDKDGWCFRCREIYEKKPN